MSRDGKIMGDSPSVTRAQPTIAYKREEVKLSTVENPWKAKDKSTANLSEEEKPHIDLLRQFRGILNKITVSTFKKLLEKILELPVYTERDLEEVMILVFNKAVNEPQHSKIYAILCQVIAEEYEVKRENGEEVNFRKILLARCQKEFETRTKDDDMMVQKMQELEKAQSDDEKARLNDEFNSFQYKARERKLGYMRFLGELFLLCMLTPQIMNECVIRLLKARNEENLEYLCRLWSTIGKQLDSNEKAKAYNDQIFNRMRRIASGESRNACARIRCALWDVIELRDNNWVPQRDKNVPKTLPDIHAQLAMEKQLMKDKNLPSHNNQGRALPMLNRNCRGDQEGWSHVKTGSQRVDPTLLKLSSQKVGGGELQLGPQKKFGGWSRGSSGSGKNTPPQQKERISAPVGRFFDFRQEPDRNIIPMNRSIGRGQSRGGSYRMGTPRGSVEKKRRRAVEMLRQICRVSRGPSRESAVEGGTMRTPTSTRPAEVTVSSEGDDDQGFTKSQKLEYTIATTEAAPSQAQLSTSDIAAQLDKLLIEDSVANETVFDWVDSRLPVDVRQHPSFIRSLTTSVVQSCIDNNVLQKSKFKDRALLLYKYYDDNPEQELAALSAFEDLMTRLYHPPDLFGEFCYILSELELIADDSFCHWEKTSKNGIAVKSVAKFLARLK